MVIKTLLTMPADKSNYLDVLCRIMVYACTDKTSRMNKRTCSEVYSYFKMKTVSHSLYKVELLFKEILSHIIISFMQTILLAIPDSN